MNGQKDHTEEIRKEKVKRKEVRLNVKKHMEQCYYIRIVSLFYSEIMYCKIKM